MSKQQKDKRIRLTLPDIQMISKALRFYEENTKGALYDDPNWREISGILSNLSRRFHVLAADEGWAARRSRT